MSKKFNVGESYLLKTCYDYSKGEKNYSKCEIPSVFLGNAFFRNASRDFFRQKQEDNEAKMYFILREPIYTGRTENGVPIIRSLRIRSLRGGVLDNYEIVFGIKNGEIEDVDFQLDFNESSELLKILQELGEL